MDYDALKLENQICFQLYACSKEVIKKYKPFLDEIGLTYTQYIAMMVLWEKKSINLKELGKLLFLDSGTLTPMLKKMEKQDIITRERSGEDERNIIIKITLKGEELKKKANEIPQKIYNCISLNEDEAKKLYEILHKVLNNI